MPNDSTLSFLLCLHLLPSLRFSVCISLSFSAFCWQCSVRVFNEMPAFEVGWWRCKIDAIKKLMFKAERTCACVCSQSLAAAGTSSQRGEQREWHEHYSWGLKLKSCVFLYVIAQTELLHQFPNSIIHLYSQQQICELKNTSTATCLQCLITFHYFSFVCCANSIGSHG